MCFICAEVAETAAVITVMALPFRARIWARAKELAARLAVLFHK